ncbi:MAG: hypothetical protein WDM70_05040 [Nitrosomonadales bacterium]
MGVDVHVIGMVGGELPLLALIAVSLLDDKRGVPVGQRLLVQVIAAAVLVFGSGMGDAKYLAGVGVAALCCVDD